MNEFEQYYLEFYSDCVTQIKKKMDEININQKDIEDMTGIKQSNFSRMINGDVIPRLDTLMKVLHALDLNIKVDNKEE